MIEAETGIYNWVWTRQVLRIGYVRDGTGWGEAKAAYIEKRAQCISK